MKMAILKSIGLAFAMFTKIPMPKMDWSERNLRYVLSFMPLVGALIGALLCGWYWLAVRFNLPDMVRGAGLTALPILITGGIHLDGFCDTTDALSANTTPERAREILKDSRSGAFAVIWFGLYLITYFALACSLTQERVLPFALSFVLVRTFTALLILGTPTSSDTGLAATFQKAKGKGAYVITFLFALISVGISAAYWGLPYFFAFIALLLLYFLLRSRIGPKRFGGMSGDLAGWYLQIGELIALAAYVVVGSL
jgi:adenosylcobinamide-GDP ribazoletransferase